MQKLLPFLLHFLLLTTTSLTCTLPVFTLHSITYWSSLTYSTPAHLAVAEGYINFNLTNTAVPYTTYCTGFSSRPFVFFFGDVIYQCNIPIGDGVGNEASAQFTFSEPGGVFNVNQTLSCDSGGDHEMCVFPPFFQFFQLFLLLLF